MSVTVPDVSVALAEAWLYTALSADSQLAALVGDRIYAGIAPQTTEYPLVTYQGPGGVDTTAIGGHRVLTQVRYDVHCAVREGSIAIAAAIAARVDAALHDQTYDWDSGAHLLASQRQSSMVLSGTDTGMQTREVVLTFLLVIEEAGAV